MDDLRSERREDSVSDAVASISSIAGALAVVIFIVIATVRLLGAEGGGNPAGTIFFLILGAAVLFFIVAIVVSGLAGLVISLSRWLQSSTPDDRAGDIRSQETPGPGEGSESREASRSVG